MNMRRQTLVPYSAESNNQLVYAIVIAKDSRRVPDWVINR